MVNCQITLILTVYAVKPCTTRKIHARSHRCPRKGPKSHARHHCTIQPLNGVWIPEQLSRAGTPLKLKRSAFSRDSSTNKPRTFKHGAAALAELVDARSVHCCKSGSLPLHRLAHILRRSFDLLHETRCDRALTFSRMVTQIPNHYVQI